MYIPGLYKITNFQFHQVIEIKTGDKFLRHGHATEMGADAGAEADAEAADDVDAA